MGNLILVMAGGAVGAGARHLVGRASLSLFGPGYPWGTLAVNVFGSLAMGILAGLLARGLVAGEETTRLLIGVGVLGGFTTFSSYSLEAVQMIERRQIGLAAAYVIGSVVLAIAALFVGLMVARRAFGVPA